MAFTDREKSRQTGQPIELYLFRYGSESEAYYAYTNAEDDVSFQGIVYKPTTIKRGSINAEGSLDKSTLSVHMAQNVAIADVYAVTPPSHVTTLTIRNGHVNETDFPVAWAGRVLSVSKKINEVVFSCEPVSTSIKRNGLRRNYQYGCPHALYGVHCGASEVAATTTHNVVSVSGTVLVMATNWVAPADVPKYVGGLIQWLDIKGNREYRTILRIDNDKEIRLSGHAGGLAAGDSVDTAFGCDRTMATCSGVHNNIHNFGGFPWIPTKNPHGKNIFG